MNQTVAVRYAIGLVGESRRQAHLSSAPGPGASPLSWVTFCGLEIPAEQAEVARKPAGMPCFRCLSQFTGTACLDA
ncbi:hypothetical protein [Saccharopolyspora taberi]|uniref:Uncharacterized protein n=1 Tax=Saccharopolyspora taberi TaxID=60895 RepID=A0ABN3VDH1_9PSEU